MNTLSWQLGSSVCTPEWPRNISMHSRMAQEYRRAFQNGPGALTCIPEWARNISVHSRMAQEHHCAFQNGPGASVCIPEWPRRITVHSRMTQEHHPAFQNGPGASLCIPEWLRSISLHSRMAQYITFSFSTPHPLCSSKFKTIPKVCVCLESGIFHLFQLSLGVHGYPTELLWPSMFFLLHEILVSE